MSSRPRARSWRCRAARRCRRFRLCHPQNIGDHTSAARINGDQVPLRTELKNGDVVEVITAPVSTPNPAWLGFVRTGRARSKIRHYLKTLAHAESEGLGEKLLAQALRAEGLGNLPEDNEEHQQIWRSCCALPGTAAAPNC